MMVNADSPEYKSVFSFCPDLRQLMETSTLRPFSEELLGFVDRLSQALLKDSRVRKFPELVALAFWMRRSNLIRLKNQSFDAGRIQVARGTVFHIAPANVDTIFVYSWFLSLLCGNRNIVRISSKTSPQVELLLDVMEQILVQNLSLQVRESSLVVNYGHEESISKTFSACCDLRVIWGGDSSVQQIRQVPIPATACEMTFASKFSLSVIDAKSIIDASRGELLRWAELFYRDTYWFGQMACSSPRMLLWYADNPGSAQHARERFWVAVDNQVSKAGVQWDIADYVNKRVAVDSLAIQADVRVVVSSQNDSTRVWLNTPALYDEWHCGSGLFHEAQVSSLNDLLPILSRRVQTITYIGVPKTAWSEFLNNNSVAGIDRIVPVGRALDFNAVWDGYDMPRMFMREITID